jgi:hypothetical protein
MEVITYLPRDSRRNSDRYYEAIATFTADVLAKAEEPQSLIDTSPRHFSRGTSSTPENTLQLLRDSYT